MHLTPLCANRLLSIFPLVYIVTGFALALVCGRPGRGSLCFSFECVIVLKNRHVIVSFPGRFDYSTHRSQLQKMYNSIKEDRYINSGTVTAWFDHYHAWLNQTSQCLLVFSVCVLCVAFCVCVLLSVSVCECCVTVCVCLSVCILFYVCVIVCMHFICVMREFILSHTSTRVHTCAYKHTHMYAYGSLDVTEAFPVFLIL